MGPRAPGPSHYLTLGEAEQHSDNEEDSKLAVKREVSDQALGCHDGGWSDSQVELSSDEEEDDQTVSSKVAAAPAAPSNSKNKQAVCLMCSQGEKDR